MIVYRAWVESGSGMVGWWKYPRWGPGYKSIAGLLRHFSWPLAHYGLIEVWRFHEGTPTRDGGVPWFAPELVETYVKEIKQ